MRRDAGRLYTGVATLHTRSSMDGMGAASRSGYVPVGQQPQVHPQQPPQSAPASKQRKTFVFWSLVFLLLVLAAGNLVLTLTVLSVLRLGQGMQSLELVSEASAIKFFGDADLGHLYKKDGLFEGFSDEPVNLVGPLVLRLNEKGRPVQKLRLDGDGIQVENVDSFSVRPVFSTDTPLYNIPKALRRMEARTVEANRIVSPPNDSLEIRSETVHLKGAEGVHIDAKEVGWFADQNIFFSSTNRSIVFDKDRVVMSADKLPISAVHHMEHGYPQYKLCVCMPEGRIFRIPARTDQVAKTTCSHADLAPEHNPCI